MSFGSAGLVSTERIDQEAPRVVERPPRDPAPRAHPELPPAVRPAHFREGEDVVVREPRAPVVDRDDTAADDLREPAAPRPDPHRPSGRAPRRKEGEDGFAREPLARRRRRSSARGERPSPDFSVPTQSSAGPVPSSTARRTDASSERKDGPASTALQRRPSKRWSPEPTTLAQTVPAAASVRREASDRTCEAGSPFFGAVRLDPAVLEDRRTGVRPDPDRLRPPGRLSSRKQ